jgi:hypothetical protein
MKTSERLKIGGIGEIGKECHKQGESSRFGHLEDYLEEGRFEGKFIVTRPCPEELPTVDSGIPIEYKFHMEIFGKDAWGKYWDVWGVDKSIDEFARSDAGIGPFAHYSMQDESPDAEMGRSWAAGGGSVTLDAGVLTVYGTSGGFGAIPHEMAKEYAFLLAGELKDRGFQIHRVQEACRGFRSCYETEKRMKPEFIPSRDAIKASLRSKARPHVVYDERTGEKYEGLSWDEVIK